MANRQSVTESSQLVDGYAREHHDAIRRAVIEAWIWLEREALLVPTEGSNGIHGWVRLSRRGERLTKAIDVSAYRNTNRLPRALLHPRIAHKVWIEFLRGDYDTAVFQAFKEVEVDVRTKADLPLTLLGTRLMRRAFDPEDGPLTDLEADPGERQARSDLFAGAIGSYKNPQSHRDVNAQADETIELLLMASHLLRLVDEAVERGRNATS